MITNEKIKALADLVKHGYADLKLPKNRYFKEYNLNNDNTFVVENDGDFRGIRLGNGRKGNVGYVYLWHTNDEKDNFPSIMQIRKMLKDIINKKENKNFSFTCNDDYTTKELQEYCKVLVEKMMTCI